MIKREQDTARNNPSFPPSPNSSGPSASLTPGMGGRKEAKLVEAIKDLQGKRRQTLDVAQKVEAKLKAGAFLDKADQRALQEAESRVEALTAEMEFRQRQLRKFQTQPLSSPTKLSFSGTRSSPPTPAGAKRQANGDVDAFVEAAAAILAPSDREAGVQLARQHAAQAVEMQSARRKATLTARTLRLEAQEHKVISFSRFSSPLYLVKLCWLPGLAVSTGKTTALGAGRLSQPTEQYAITNRSAEGSKQGRPCSFSF